jgi:3-oxoacyl-[acyl-carrier-protein] synthase II
MAALHVAKEAVASSGWSAKELEGAALVVGTSRGNAAGWLGEWPGRRPFKLMAASNTIHSEPATAISIELGILGANHVTASGCSAGLDALGLGKMLVDSGSADRVLVVAVDLPLVPMLLDGYEASGLLGNGDRLNPFSKDTDGFFPGEGAAAIALSSVDTGKTVLSHFANNSDGKDPVGVPKDGGRTSLLITDAILKFGEPCAICPHSTGTKIQARAEREILSRSMLNGEASLHLLKPYFGHTVGASGLLESAVLLRFMENSQLPPNLPGTSGTATMHAPVDPARLSGSVFKLAHGMGGHNALAVFQNIS